MDAAAARPAESLADLSWCEADERMRETEVAILPVGSTEAHGPHLPLQTDLVIARESAVRGARRLARDGVGALVLPAIAYGVAYVSSPFAGTITVSPDTLFNLVRDICVSVASHGVKYICISNAHLEPAHVRALREAAKSVEEQKVCRVALADQREERWASMLSEEFRQGARHAGSYETSLVWAARPDLVKVDKLEGLEPIWVDLPARLNAGAKNFKDAGSPLAYFGDPAKASQQEGDSLYDALAEMIASTVMEMMTRGK